MRGTTTTIAITLLLASCGAAAASQSSVPSASAPAASAAPLATEPSAVSTSPAPTTVAHRINDAEAAFPARLALTTKDGHVVTLSPHATPVVTAAVMAPTGKVMVSADALGGHTTVEWHDLRTDVISTSIQIDGDFHPAAVAQDGKLVALISPGETSTTVVLATPSQGEMRRWTFDAVVVPEAFDNAFDSPSDGLPMGVFVIEYLAAHTYRVRVIDTATGQLGLPLNLRDKSQTVDEVMTAVSRTAVFEPVNQLLFTLYQDASEGSENVGSFIHTLGLFNGVWCLDVPSELGLADHPGALAVSPDGTRLYAASSTGGVAGYTVSDITNFGPEMPKARVVAALGSSSSRAAIAASNDEVVVALGGSIFRLDPQTLAVRDQFTWDMDVEALTLLDDGSIVIVGTRRITMVSPDHQLVAERILPMDLAEITRLAVVD
jgi:DNA-binding beta-propeller fold protein YncE